ncbi:MAG TPA: RNA 3'-terminal phosphate cyclase [Planctomycetota bacterium]|nr:RNA 3'-terminal phosphate cyclase [Planctomycetota bacterium]
MIEIDGSTGEGGGQILRSSLGLSLLTGIPFRIYSIRAGRDNPGLQRQHLAAVKAAAEVGRADVKGATIGSREVVFRPGKVEPGRYAFSVGSAGSATLVFQTVLPALLTASGPSTIALEGGTHNPWAPPYDFLEKAFLPLLNRMGPKVTATLGRRGFYPAGGGRAEITIEPVAMLAPLELLERGPVRTTRATAIVASLSPEIARRELRELGRKLDLTSTHVVEDRTSPGPGNAVVVEIESEHVTEVFTGFGEKRVSAEKVAALVGDEAKAYLDSGAPVGEHLADQLLLPLALAGAGGFVTTELSHHATTNMEVIGMFLGTKFVRELLAEGRVRIGLRKP